VKGDAWVLGVQWEIQESWKSDDRFLAVFEAFVERAHVVRSLAGHDHDEDPRRAVP
jgi:gamma-glutamyl-gamma-aminobutyrate hydrolase PuuD